MTSLQFRVYEMDIDLTQKIFDTTPVRITGVGDEDYKSDIPEAVLLWPLHTKSLRMAIGWTSDSHRMDILQNGFCTQFFQWMEVIF